MILLILPLFSTESNGNRFIPDPCAVYGLFFIEEFPEQAQYFVYIEDSEAFADIIVFEEENRLFADEPGHWFFVENRNFAHYSIYFVENRDNADFSVYFTDISSFAGCNN